MALTLYKAPAQFSLVGNPVTVKLQTNNLIVSAGVKAVFNIASINLAIADGENFNLAWKDYSVTFTFKANPDNSGTQLSLAGGLTQTQFNAQIASQMAENFYISQDFDLTSNAGFVYLTAKEVGSDYNIIYTADPAISDFVGTIGTSGTDVVYQPNFKAWLKVMGYNPTLLTCLNTDSLPPDADGYITFEISEILKGLFALKYQFPDPGTAGPLIYHRPGSVGPFQLQYCEAINGVPQKLVKPADIYYAIPGGVSSEDKKYYDLFQLDYYNYTGNTVKFLTWQPNNTIVSKTQSNRLFFFTPDPITNLTIYCKIYYTNNTTHILYPATQSNAIENTVYEIICGFASLNLDSFYPSKTILKYDIAIYDGAFISEIRTFIIDTKVYRNEKYFDFRNSFGAYDSVRFTGEVIRSLETERESAKLINELYDVETIDQHIEGSHVFKANTGWLDRSNEDGIAYSHYLNDFLLSHEIYEVRGMKRTRIRITANKFEKHRTNENLYSLEFTFEYVSTDTHHSNENNEWEDVQFTLGDIVLFDEGKALTE